MNKLTYNLIRHYEETYITISSHDILETILYNFSLDVSPNTPVDEVVDAIEYLSESLWEPYHV